MKKYLLNILVFFAVVLFIDFAFGMVCDYMNAHSKGGMSKQMYDLCMKNHYDVLIMGSSRAHHHYVPQVIEDSLGISCYNAGYDGNGIIMMTGIYRMIIQRYLPKLIIYDVEQAFDLFEYRKDNNRTRYLALLKPYHKQEGIGCIFKDISTKEYYKSYSGLCRYNSVSITLLVDCLKKRHMDDKGFSPFFGEIKEAPSKEIVENNVIDTVKIRYFHNFVKDVTERDIPLLVVASPRLGAADSRVLDPIKEICDNYSVKFVDYYYDRKFQLHKEWFKDPMHLNYEGAKAFTQNLVDEIEF